MIIDIRLRPPYGTLLRVPAPYGPRGREVSERIRIPFPESAEKQSMEMCLKEMDEAGITIGVATGRATAPGTSNDDLAQLCKDYPKRFLAIATLDPRGQRDAMVAEFRRSVKELDMRGLILEPGASAKLLNVDDGSLYCLYEEAAALKVPVLYTLSNFVGADIGYCLNNLIALDRVCGDFPKVNFVVAHAGWPYVEAGIALALKRKNAYLSPDFYSMDFPFSQEYFKAANTFLQDQYLFGSAYPFYPIGPAVDNNRKYLRPEVQQKVFYDNSARLLGLAG